MYQISIASSDNVQCLFSGLLALFITYAREVPLKFVPRPFTAVFTKNSGNIASARRISLMNDSFSAVNRNSRLPHLEFELELDESYSQNNSVFKSS